MNERAAELLKLKSYTEDIDKDLTMILQSLQWDRKHILQHATMVSCKYDPNHKVLADKVEEHERECLLRQNGYTKEDQFLPDPLSNTANTLITFSKQDIAQIIDHAVKTDPTFKAVCCYTLHGPKQLCLPCIGSAGLEPQTLARLQCTYSVDERRVIHDAVVSAVPFCHDLTDLALPSVGEDGKAQKPKTRTEILAELRNMRRRRTKYRVATKSRNYSDVLRDVIKTQMELYNEVVTEAGTRPNIIEHNTDKRIHHDDMHSKGVDRDRGADRTEFNTCETNRDTDKYNKEKSYKDQRNKDNFRSRHEDSQSRDYNSERSRDIQHYKRHNNDHRTRDLDDHNIHTEESRDRKHRDRSKERGHDERRDTEYRRKDRRHDDGQSREHKKRERTREYDRSTEKHSIQEYSDTERYRRSVPDIKHEHSDRSKDKYSEDSDRGHKRYRDSIKSGSKESRDRYRDSHKGSHKDSHKDSRKDSHRNESYEKEAKRARTADKHKSYYEIYAELDKRRRKDRDSDNDCK